ncbi:hypothetical protein [Paludisphaera borealis]|uniref:Type II secretion system protein GspG C-terminal domain-containing protein n=1 Tax=Paludisphaera borealis TaxID=1387353 RepID=A0A1U7CT13_9BACT|nr:hypothetical protein [Paludisphaera borealis]APW62084.1 hypothetical protein BSF38_03616 [Paludisphaera borealis]
MIRFLDLFDHHVQSTSRPYSEAVSRKYSDSSRGCLPNPLRPLVTLLDPSLVSTRQAAERSRALFRSLLVLNAIQAREGGDDHAPDINNLDLPAEATIDPFNGEPLHVKKPPDGWKVYSVGSDGLDDGGTLDGKTDFGFGPIERHESPK